MIKVLIVDDEPLARENLRVFLQEQSDIEIVGECSNAVEGIGAVHKLRPDVLFLDIQMPRISGLEMVGMLDPEHRPYIVFLTAFDEYAGAFASGTQQAGCFAVTGKSTGAEIYPLYGA